MKLGNAERSRVVVVTGAATGIGKAIASKFARAGFTIIMLDKDTKRGLKVAAELCRQQYDASFHECDVTSESAIAELGQSLSDKYGGFDILVNVAGITIRADATELSLEQWNRVLATNTTSVFLLSRLAVHAMRNRGGGAIVNIASGWGLVGGAKAVAYCASKGAVVLITKAMAIDHGRDKIRVNCICPGDTDTEMLETEAKQLNLPENSLLEAASDRPLKRVGRPDEIADAAYYLASDKASFITGEALVVDGGGLAGSA